MAVLFSLSQGLSLTDPAFTPLFVGETAVVVCKTKLKTDRKTGGQLMLPFLIAGQNMGVGIGRNYPPIRQM